jgi:hypothetical protein
VAPEPHQAGTVLKTPVEKGGCGVMLERTAAKRDFYVGIALLTVPRLAVVAGGQA